MELIYNLKKFKFLFLFLFLPFFVSAEELGYGGINPAESVGITVEQSLLSFDSDPGKTIDFKIAIKNISQNEQRISVYAQDFSVEDNNQIQILSEGNELYGMKDWIKLGEKDLILKSEERKEINFSLDVPRDAAVGSHYASIFFQAFPPIDGQNFQKTIVSGRVGSFVLLNVSGEISGKGNLNNFTSPIVAGEKSDFRAEFENTGNIFYIPHGEIAVKNLLTRKEKKMEVAKHFVFPGKKYTFDLEWAPESALGVYRAKAYFVDGDRNVHSSGRFVFGEMAWLWPLIVIALPVIFYWRSRVKNKK